MVQEIENLEDENTILQKKYGDVKQTLESTRKKIKKLNQEKNENSQVCACVSFKYHIFARFISAN